MYDLKPFGCKISERTQYPAQMHSASESRMELHLWGGGWGLPSIDPECLQALATVRFGGAPTTIKECNNPWSSPKGVIPFFKQLNSEYLFSAHEIGLYLRSKNFSGDYGLTSIQCAETVAYSQLIWEALHVAYQYLCWVHESNYNEIIRPFYGRRLPWAYKLWYPDRMRNSARQVIYSLYRDAESKPESVETFILEKAKRCIQLLSEKLGTNEFFMGMSSPTTIDAVAFSYLAVFWKVNLLHNPLKEVIVSCPHIERYMARILQRYFPVGGRTPLGLGSCSAIIYNHEGEAIDKERDALEEASVKPKVFAGLMAAIVMLIYALKNGIVRLPSQYVITASHIEEDDEDYWE